MLTPQEVQEIKAQSDRLAETWPRGGKAQADLIAKWRQDRPKMAEELAKQGVLVAFAHLSIHRADDAEVMYREAGMPIPDAREQAAAEWLLQTPESEEEGNQPQPILNLPLSGRTTGSQTPTP